MNFLGQSDEFVVSGSDDGNWFMWRKATGQLVDILEGDGSVVNVIEGHPHLPLVAVSGIDTTVKVRLRQESLSLNTEDRFVTQLFAPAHGPGPREFSRVANAESVIQRNVKTAASRVDLTSWLLRCEIARRLETGSMTREQCTTQ